MSKARQIFLHSIVWLGLLLFFVFVGSRNSSLQDSVIIFLYFGLFNIALFYVNYLYLLPNFLNTRRYLACAVSITSLIIVSALIKYGLANVFWETVLLRGQNQTRIGFWEYFLGSVFTSTFFVFISTAFKFTSDWFVNEKIRKNLEKDKLSAELAFLKSQINPHFLFNSLNNIYSLAYQKSDKTPEAILKLSEIMRYMLQESNEVQVDLSRELRYLDNYIELQKLRFKNEAYVEFNITGSHINHRIAPLILIAFVENAFKHGLASDPENPIKLAVIINGSGLQFNVWNKKSLQNKDLTSGIGLNNVKRRLELLYPGKYKLNITDTPSVYYCELSLDL
ncbi:sensor histidine kinase [Pedobacter sp. SYSU D00535]|uniref:sensor histidine kinase n=1 Tax=Pedobacter sp. SYSU D00535 TaxID=2810308 RepID=UPI001A95BD8E|nr:histidine kinase [Pedobacter sp. SYSU D00535]